MNILNFLSAFFGDSNKRKLKKYEAKVKKINALESKIQALTDKELRAKTDEFKQRIQFALKKNKKIENQNVNFKKNITTIDRKNNDNNSCANYKNNNKKKTKKDNNSIITDNCDNNNIYNTIDSDDKLKEIENEIIKKELDEMLPEAFAVIREASRRVLGMRHFDVQLIGGMILHDGAIAEMKTGEGKTLVETLPAYLNALSGKGVHIITVNDYLVKRDSEWMGKIFEFLGLTVGCVTEDTPQEARKTEYAKDITYATNNELGFDYLRDNIKVSLDDMVLINRGFNFAIVDEVDSILIDESRTPLIISGPTTHDPRIYIAIDKIVSQLNPEDYEIDEKHKNVQLTDVGNTHIENLLHRAQILAKEEELYSSNSIALLNFILQSLRAHTLFKNGVDYIVKNGQAMIIDEFTGRIMDGRRYSDGLHQAIEAKEHLQIAPENQTLASITYQNFFRMYNKLSGMTGTAKTEAAEFFDIYKLPIVSVPTNKKVCRQDLDDLVYKNESEKFNAIIEAVKKANKIGQPVLIGTVSIEKSEKLSELLKNAKIKHNLLNAKHHEKEAEIIAEAGRFGAVTIATNMAGRGTDIMLGGNIQKETDKMITSAIAENQSKLEKVNKTTTSEKKKKEILKTITTVDAEKIAKEVKLKHKKEYEDVVKAGGLFVIGSERHENRRIDNQLIGRSGRQGDPGKTQFYLSLHDDLLRIFGGEKIDTFLSKFGFKGGEAMNHPMLNNIINKSQKKIESYHYEVRKNLLKYDDIINEQRKIIYEQRMNFVKSNNINNILKQIINDVNTDIVANATHNDKVDPKELKELMSDIYLIPRSKMDFVRYDVGSINKYCFFVYSNKYFNIDFNTLTEIQRRVMLQTLDECWQEHLYCLDHIKESIHLQAYAHKDPFNEYKFESYKLMQKTMNNFIYIVVKRLFNLTIETDEDNKKNK